MLKLLVKEVVFSYRIGSKFISSTDFTRLRDWTQASYRLHAWGQILLSAAVIAALLYSTLSRAQSNPALSGIFQNALACALVAPLLANGEAATLFALEDAQCASVVPDDDHDARYYLDASP